MAGAVRRAAALEVREGARALLAVILIAGVGGGLVLAAWAAARRTDSAYERFVAATDPVDVIIPGSEAIGYTANAPLDQVEALDMVEGSWRATAFIYAARLPSGREISGGDLPMIAHGDDFGRTVHKWKILEGRLPARGSPDEAIISFLAAEQLGLHVGDEIVVHHAVASQLLDFFAIRGADFDGSIVNGLAPGSTTFDIAAGDESRVRVVGIGANVFGFPPVTAGIAAPMHVTHAFAERHRDRSLQLPVAYIKLRGGPAAIPKFRSELDRLAGGRPTVVLTARDVQDVVVTRSIKLLANSLRLIATLVTIVAGVLTVLAVGRGSRDARNRSVVLRSLGMTRRDRVFVRSVVVAPVALGGALVAAALATVMSPLAPIGLARTAEPDPGIDVDVVVLGVGVVVIFVVVMAAGVAAAIRSAMASDIRAAAPPEQRGHIAFLARRLPVAASVGLRSALGSLRRSGVAVASGALAMAAVIGAGTVAASLDHVLRSPALYGYSWDVTLGAPGVTDLSAFLSPLIGGAESVDAAVEGSLDQLVLEGRRTPVFGSKDIRGHLDPVVVEGRGVRADDEIVLGTGTFDDVGAAVGSTVTLRSDSAEAEFTVVGRAVLPDLSDGGERGDGALTTLAGLRRLTPDAPVIYFLIRLGGPASAAADRAENFISTVSPYPAATPRPPRDLANFGRVDQLPAIVAALTTLLAIGALLNALAAGARDRRREVAVLRTLGLVRRQVRVTFVVQALAVVAAAAVAGVVLGSSGGRWTWRELADELGVVAEVVTPSGLLAGAVAGALVLAVLSATPAGRRAASVKPAAALRRD